MGRGIGDGGADGWMDEWVVEDGQVEVMDARIGVRTGVVRSRAACGRDGHSGPGWGGRESKVLPTEVPAALLEED